MNNIRTKYRHIGITAKSGLDKKEKAVSKIVKILRKLDIEICIDSKRISGLECVKNLGTIKTFNDIDLLIVIGGDGTILRAARDLKGLDIPILSVNWGTVGFLAEIDLLEADDLIPRMLKGGGAIEERSLLHVRAHRNGSVILEGHALNEAAISQGTIARLVNLKTAVNEEHLVTYHSDGLIISTPTGSTAYSLAAGGPIVYPTLNTMILTPINPYSFSQKPIVIPGEFKIDVEVETKPNKYRDAEVVLTIDGQIYASLINGDHIEAYIHRDTVKFLRRKQDTFFATLRKKLKWGERAG